MSEFLTGKKLGDKIYDIIWNAEKILLIVSPYVKLDSYFKKIFDKHENNSGLHIILVFGKNETEVKRSMNKEDFDYFKKFPNISIVHVPNLHAKYYGNETCGIVTSINLYDYSFLNNIEFGVFSTTNHSFFSSKNNYDDEAFHTCLQLANDNTAVFIKRPQYEYKKVLLLSSKNFIGSKVLHDSTEYYYSFKRGNYEIKRMDDFPSEIEVNGNSKYEERPEREEVSNKPQFGYCIRTGEKIPFNPKQPLSKEAWRVWSEFGNLDFPEKFCHKTGEKSYGKTSMRNPILFK
ncbi:hypothetical protein [Flavobacterium coralii]|uniref:hypothetical protein n=1 Tax=Flavobacterium coralii TaxID=2838017 RepID=UPI000C4AAC11|nr:hypothetical protein [Flavobacterium sp.]|tara:strand:+ start:681 stop:1550 length:870 start_codon:yes stop_codon:yes gene_type:complete